MISDYITDITQSPDKIQFANPQPFGITYFKLAIYNPQIAEPLQKFWFHLTKAKIIATNTDSITIALSSHENDTKLVNYIKKIEEKVKTFITTRLKSFKQLKSSFIIKDHYPPNICINIPSDTPIFDAKDNETNTPALTLHKCISCIIELSEILVAGSEAWIIWNFLQIKLFDDIDFKKSLFRKIDSVPSESVFNNRGPYESVFNNRGPSEIIFNNRGPNAPVPIPPPERYTAFATAPPPAPAAPQAPNVQGYAQMEPPWAHAPMPSTIKPVPKKENMTRIVITQSALLDQITKLKKNKISDAEAKPETLLISKNPMAGLNRTVSREPLPPSVWFNKAKEDEMNMLALDYLRSRLDQIVSQRDDAKDKINSITNKYILLKSQFA